ncbi:glycine dehydrogenase (decarboxylating) beta subunit [Thermaerobacter marianensis DSM 12885]|uniref:Probable glycine dehydrogenase (decarboxylating) subunit 2 n=1 Tax=Thermaerobacter marianensis (strain ATCC 700841 / DSM 12885 / JCM 10246 / 7p75a) TaxID=644966 RepID=E6SL71_THEM7|nr:aminomethyl-transferring glycine dehydrogenase subunit GcvPB [Thermaerobacter marianensis]ADU51302.1 glycine dehydrogenase (decarboxylating) beta subunit [Thermaerobacter marianensis DSM 12885]
MSVDREGGRPGDGQAPAGVPVGARAAEGVPAAPQTKGEGPVASLDAGAGSAAAPGRRDEPAPVGAEPEPLIFAYSRPGRGGVRWPAPDVPVRPVEERVPAELLRRDPPALPEVAEVDLVRHYTRLSQMNHAVDTGFYPLGSCTMKYNPKVNERVAALPGFADLHPYVPDELAQGALRLMYDLERALCEIGGMARATLQPAAGAHGELTGILLIRAYHRSRGQGHRYKVIVPDSAHGTNPATAAMAGYKVVEVPSDARGGVDLKALEAVLDEDVAALMLTNPNTLGLFDENIHRIAEMVHAAGGLLYYDGANANAILGISRPGDMGFDVVHFNLHKTFSTPHGGGGPGAGPVGVKEELVPFLPAPLVERDPATGRFYLDHDRPQAIGRMRSFYGNFAVLVRAYAYIRALGAEGLRRVSEDAVLNANYVMRQLAGLYRLPYDRTCMHEFVLSASNLRERTGIRALDVAKRLLDFGIHPPTIYFPLIVEEALMIEPTETESKETLDRFVAVMRRIAREAEEEPDVVRQAPHTTPVGRLDEALAARRPVLRWRPDGEG